MAGVDRQGLVEHGLGHVQPLALAPEGRPLHQHGDAPGLGPGLAGGGRGGGADRDRPAFGQKQAVGTGMALAGAWILAEELARQPLAAAQARYEDRLRARVGYLQRMARRGARHYVPRRKFDLWLQSHLVPLSMSRLLLPLTVRRMLPPDIC
ncbi:hypothetical protein [Zavarzinia compransoris]|uniref:hypothetical protein n=1 Tax=Zavarzinia compransoris TaxID=1264899 RepID=UPI001414EBD1|nr:hypothetical protein [Zavarzinia compransoris]